MERLGTIAIKVLTLLRDRKSEFCTREMVEKSGGKLETEILYVTLRRMEEQKLITSRKRHSEFGRRARMAKYYKSTPQGRREIKQWNKDIDMITTAALH